MSAKTNKSIKSRIRVSKRGSLLAQAKGRGHFNAKHSRSKQLPRRKQGEVVISKKIQQRYILK